MDPPLLIAAIGAAGAAMPKVLDWLSGRRADLIRREQQFRETLLKRLGELEQTERDLRRENLALAGKVLELEDEARDAKALAASATARADDALVAREALRCELTQVRLELTEHRARCPGTGEKPSGTA